MLRARLARHPVKWKQTDKGGEHAVSPDSIGNPNLQLKVYVPAGEILLTGTPNDESNGYTLKAGTGAA